MPIFCKEEGEPCEIIAIDWYNGSEGYVDANAPSLGVAFTNGKVQLMRNELDESEPCSIIIIDDRHHNLTRDRACSDRYRDEAQPHAVESRWYGSCRDRCA